MAQAPREFALDIKRGKIFASPYAETSYEQKKFKNGDTDRLAIWLVKQSLTQGEGRLDIISPAGLQLKVALGQFGAAPYTSVTLTPSGNQFVGDLPLNVSGISNLFSSQTADVEALLEFELNDGGYFQSLDIPATIRHQLITNALIDTPAPDSALGKAEAAGLYVPVVRPAGYREIWTNDEGGQVLVYMAGGTLHFDPIS